MLKEIKQFQITENASKDTIAQLNYAIEKIGSRSIYEIDKPFIDTLDLHESKAHVSVTRGWIHEFSTMGLEILRDISLQKSLEQRKKSMDDQIEADTRSRAPSLNTVQKYINKYDHLLQKVEMVDFNIHRFVE